MRIFDLIADFIGRQINQQMTRNFACRRLYKLMYQDINHAWMSKQR